MNSRMLVTVQRMNSNSPNGDQYKPCQESVEATIYPEVVESYSPWMLAPRKSRQGPKTTSTTHMGRKGTGSSGDPGHKGKSRYSVMTVEDPLEPGLVAWLKVTVSVTNSKDPESYRS